MSQPESDWKQKYLDNLDRLENIEKRRQEIENLLRMGITRVALAAQGVDKKLDEQLDYLRKSIRTGEDYPGLEAIVEDISASVKRIDQLRNGESTALSSPKSVFEALLSSVEFPKHVVKRVRQLQKQIKEWDSEQPLDEALRNLASIMKDSVSPETTADQKPKGNFFDRLFNPADANSPTQQMHATLPLDIMHRAVDEIVKGAIPAQALQSIHSCIDSALTEEQILFCLSNIKPALPPPTQASTTPLQVHKGSMEQTTVATLNTDHLLSLIDELQLEQTQANHITALKAQIKRAQQAGDLTVIVHELAVLVRKAFTFAASTPKVALSEQEQPSLSNFCLQLIDTLNFPRELQAQANSLREKIITGVSYQDSPLILNGIADLVTLTRVRIETEKKDLESFLQQLTKNLSDIDAHIAGAETHRMAGLQNSKAFGDAVEAQMNDLQSSMQGAAELSQLKGIIQAKLDAIRAHIVEYRDGDLARQTQLEQELIQSNIQLKALEKEAQQLRERLNAEHEQAIIDALTGVYNRLAYEERMEQEFARYKRYRKPLALLIFDIDYFKKINDNFGHKAGDKALRIIAKCLQTNLRESDFMARYGGEEFVVLMPETDINAAITAANKLRTAVEANPFHYQEKNVPITVSCGIAQFRDSDSPESVFQRADQALYFCKQNGRNRCHAK